MSPLPLVSQINLRMDRSLMLPWRTRVGRILRRFIGCCVLWPRSAYFTRATTRITTFRTTSTSIQISARCRISAVSCRRPDEKAAGDHRARHQPYLRSTSLVPARTPKPTHIQSAGLTEKLDYLEDLGVTALWLLPFYPSSGRDDGYDISEPPHQSRFRHDAGFPPFHAGGQTKKLRVITELVINHTSDQHRWFQRARRSRPTSRAQD